MQIALISMLLWSLVGGVNAQTIKEIKHSEAYIWGEGKGSNLKQADKAAINDLISQISIQVESKFVNMVSEEDGDVSEYAKMVLKTYSNTTLNQAKRKVIEKRGKVTVVRYLAKTDLDQLFRDRKRKIIDYTQSAIHAEKELRIADALKYYYWALVLLRSHPDHNSIQFEFPQQGKRLLLTTLPDRINRVFSLLRISVKEITESSDQQKRTVLLDISYQHQPVQNLDYIYWVGDTWTGLMSAKDGLGVAEFFGEAGRCLDFALSDKAIQDILDKGKRFGSPKHKYQLIQVMEYYKTAYCLERIDYIESIFAENALIIVGHVLREAEPIDGMYQLLGDRVRYVRLAKQEYIANLKWVFGRNEFLNIHFEDNTVKKVGGEDKVYGIQIAQHWYSTNYSDKGYLFLMLDLNKPEQPKIYVRSWQPEKNPDGSIIGLSDFHF